VLVLVDGLRADPPGEAAAEAALVEAASLDDPVRFERAYAQSPSARLGLRSLLSGRYPAAIPVCLPAEGGEAGDGLECVEVPDSRPMLQEVLSAYGYHTALFELDVASWTDLPPRLALEPAVGPTRGFGATGQVTLDEWAGGASPGIQSWWAQHADSPRFLLVRGALGSVELAEACDAFQQGHPLGASAATPEENAGVEGAYRQAAVRAGAFVASLERDLTAGAGGRWLLLGSLYGMNLTRLEGTQANQLGCPTHRHLLERNLHVPLWVEGAGDSPRADGVVQLIDVVPTLVAAAGAVPPAGLPGRGLFTASDEDDAAYAEFGDMLALRQGARMVTVRCFQHGTTALDPGLTDLVEHDLAGLRAGGEGQAPQGRCELRLHDVERDYFQVHDLAESDGAALLAGFERLVALRRGPAAPAPTGNPALAPAGSRLDYW
jgi:hypothetical protein